MLESAARHFAGEHLVKQHAERVDVRAMVHERPRFRLLRRGVVRRAHGGERERGSGGGVFAEQLRETEVGDLHAPVRIEEDVAGLDVAMDAALLVRVGERAAHLLDERERDGLRDFPRRDQLREVAARDVFHHDESVPVRSPSVAMHGDDVRVVQPRHRPRLALEALPEARIVMLRGDKFDRHIAIQIELPRPENRAHPTAPDLLLDAKAGDRIAQFIEREISGGRLIRAAEQQTARAHPTRRCRTGKGVTALLASLVRHANAAISASISFSTSAGSLSVSAISRWSVSRYFARSRATAFFTAFSESPSDTPASAYPK